MSSASCRTPDRRIEARGPEILELIDNGDGAPSDEAIDQLVAVVSDAGGDLVNAEEVLQGVLDDVWDTLDHDLVFVDVDDPANLTIDQQIGGIGTTLTGMGLDPLTGRLFVSNLEPRNLVRNESELRGHFVDHQIVIVDSAAPDAPIVTDLHSGIDDFDDVSAPNLPAQAGSLANPVDVVFDAAGSRAYVAALSVDRVGVLDPADAGVLGSVEVGRGPRGLALASDRQLLFTLNRTDMSISMLDVSTDSPSVIATLELRSPEPASVRDGRNFLYSARFSNNFGSSCSMCHIDGRRDHLSWDLSEPDGLLQPGPNSFRNPGEFAVNHPIKGPMFTQTFQGLADHNPFHWRGDRPSLEDFNPTFDALLGGEELSAEDMASFQVFLESIRFPPNPFRLRDDSFQDERAIEGEAIFATACNFCHMVSNDGAARIDGDDGDAGLIARTSGPQTQLVRQLRGVYRKFDSDLYAGFGLSHSGRERREDTDHPLIPLFREFPDILPTDEIIDQTIAFVTAFNGDFAPVVGWQVAPEAPVSAEERSDLQLMIDRHAGIPSENDVVVHGTIDGERRTLLLTTDAGGALVFADAAGSFDLDGLVARVDAGDPLVFLATPPRQPAFADDFESLELWITDPDGTDTAETGQWEIGDPESTFSDDTNDEIQLGDTTSGSAALVTELSGDSLGCCDVDDGVTSVRSPAILLPVGVGIRLSLNYNFAHTENVDADDFFRITVEGESVDLVVVEIFGQEGDERAGEWVALDADLSELAGETVTLLVEANDSPDDGSIIEAAIDDVVLDLETLPGGNLAPDLTNPGAQLDLLGSEIALALTADDPNGDPLTFSATGLPTGLVIDEGTGLISGVAAEVGSFNVEATVTDESLSDTVSFVWTVTDGPIFEDDFETDRGWVTNPDGNDEATTGVWEVGRNRRRR